VHKLTVLEATNAEQAWFNKTRQYLGQCFQCPQSNWLFPEHIVSLDVVNFNSMDYSALTKADYMLVGKRQVIFVFQIIEL